MRIYLDACSIQRPLDDRSQPRINIEAEAVLTILRFVETSNLELLSSEALDFEIDRIPNLQRKLQATEMLKLASCVIEVNDEIDTQAEGFIKAGIKPMDALHLASASWVKADYFCTCDDNLLRKSRDLNALTTVVVSPLQLVTEIAS